ncbi:DUF3089 domain-containing protein [Sphingomonas sp. MAH-20]|uniref:DUF3089 domain-containing protein n=1 Tax=Sphingomonas horti TaxID=2682842 RepID=A0A6I4IZ97_9SPHN|nr:DUF3089 domain-containing protein [Sphingomonas sp. CGMCC 1.13658]MBA2918189.1 DUF3089 domain-containing protein [Sphingomonas sp. CGMCC 1.13658]MVO77158.1 DUF3089 domain-containing protein [Sphingomonas horti]
MDRKFLYVIAALIVLVLGAGIAYQLFGTDLFRRVFVPSVAFTAEPPQARGAYADPAMWYSRPGKGHSDPALWAPAGYQPNPNPPAALFFVHPTSFLDRDAWNMALDNVEANQRARLFIRGQASAWNDVAAVWAPKYRQATFGAFLTNKADAQKALDLAYRDVLAAFDTFLAMVPKDRPIFLAGHSQGALHLERLLRERVAGTPLAKRIVAAYVVGWPISLTTDLPALGLPACTRADQAGCVLSWMSFAEPADPDLITDTYDASTGFDGQPRKGTPFLCVNPITGTQDGAAPASANLGTLYPSEDLSAAEIKAGQVPARCAGRGILLIGEGPKLAPYVLPGNNYHVFDISLFWANVRADAARRLASYEKQ